MRSNGNVGNRLEVRAGLEKPDLVTVQLPALCRDGASISSSFPLLFRHTAGRQAYQLLYFSLAYQLPSGCGI